MMTIKEFREEPYGLFLDYEGCPGGLAVNIETGNVYLSDAPWHPATSGGMVGMIEKSDILRFQSQPKSSNALKLVSRSNERRTIPNGTKSWQP